MSTQLGKVEVSRDEIKGLVVDVLLLSILLVGVYGMIDKALRLLLYHFMATTGISVILFRSLSSKLEAEQ